MKTETVDGKTRVTIHWTELVGDAMPPTQKTSLNARDVLSSSHPLHNEFRVWFCERHSITNPVDAAFAIEKRMTSRQASKFLRETGRR